MLKSLKYEISLFYINIILKIRRNNDVYAYSIFQIKEYKSS